MIRRILLCVLALGLASCGRKPAELKTEYTLHVAAEPPTYWAMGAMRFVELVREKTGGRINIQPYFGSQLRKGAQRNASQMVAVGAIDAALDSTINMAPFVPEMDVFSLPFFAGAYENVDHMIDGQTGKLLDRAMRTRGLTLLGWGENGFHFLTNNKRLVQTPADLKGLKLRVAGSPILVDIFRALGAEPVEMSWDEAVAAFQKGTLDGQEDPAEILLSVQTEQYQKYLTCWNCAIDPLVFYWNRRQFEAFPKDIQNAIRQAAWEAGRYQKAYARVGLDDGFAFHVLLNEFDELAPVVDPVAFLRSKGMEVTELNVEQLRAFETVLLPVRGQWIRKIGKAVYRAALADIQAAQDKQ